jgi:flagellar motor protein MotB
MAVNSEDEPIGYWPGIADLFLGILLLVLLWLIVGQVASRRRVVLDLSRIRAEQDSIVASLRDTLQGSQFTCPNSETVITIGEAEAACTLDSGVVRVSSDVKNQRITFSSEILFAKDSYRLRPSGSSILDKVGAVLKSRTRDLVEIQVTGHADPDRTSHFSSNYELAGLRAIQVLQYLQTCCGIDPNVILMSATSFGEFSPVARVEGQAWNEERLGSANSTPQEKARNRRVELRLTYRAGTAGGGSR